MSYHTHTRAHYHFASITQLAAPTLTQLTRDMSQTYRHSSMVARVEPGQEPVRPNLWFRLATVAVIGCIIGKYKHLIWISLSKLTSYSSPAGIVIIVLGAIMLLLKYIRIQAHFDDKTHYYYFGTRVPKALGWYALAAGLFLLLFAFILYHAALVRIERYIQTLASLVDGPRREKQPLLLDQPDGYRQQSAAAAAFKPDKPKRSKKKPETDIH